ncbi:putative addiction module antidote protein [Chromatium okenii]|uniref:addiction module antidote protein n=1 Tax=Chromatium okenii TaxID=61644 RepID=UPI001905B383|nr:addiction module antidote protein [Chromatium okenii]MBK1642667.1 putative addiction module antidote protein [Chromatium okenii]
MDTKIKISDLPDFDPAEYLNDEKDIEIYLSLVIEENDPSELVHALDVVARARGMSEIAKQSGMTREALFESLRLNTPCVTTIKRVYQALGVKIPLEQL